jgi:hypothetical protein
MENETKYEPLEKRDSKGLDSSLKTAQQISKYFCYVCGAENPQLIGRLFDARWVSYCGDCWNAVKQGKEVYYGH